MAFVPDEALDDASTVSKTAFALYVFICRWRNHRYKNSILNLPAAQATLALSRSQIYRNISELKAAGWIVIRGDFVTPIKGSFSRVDKPLHKSQICENDSQICDTESQICDNAQYSYPAFKSSLKENEKIYVRKTKKKTTETTCPHQCENGYYRSKYDSTSNPCPIHAEFSAPTGGN